MSDASPPLPPDLPRLRAALARLKEVGDRATPGPCDVSRSYGTDGLWHGSYSVITRAGGDSLVLATFWGDDRPVDDPRPAQENASVFLAARDLPAADLLEGLDALLALAGRLAELERERDFYRDELIGQWEEFYIEEEGLDEPHAAKKARGIVAFLWEDHAAHEALSAPDDGHEQDEGDA